MEYLTESLAGAKAATWELDARRAAKAAEIFMVISVVLGWIMHYVTKQLCCDATDVAKAGGW